MLSIVFFTSFCTYFFENLKTLQPVPIVILVILAFGKFINANSHLKGNILHDFAEVSNITIIFLIPLVTITTSILINYNERSIYYSIVFVLCVTSIRLLLSFYTIEEIMKAFFIAGILSILIYTYYGYNIIISSFLNKNRLVSFNYHPNLIAYLMVGYFGSFIWYFLKYKRQRFIALLLMALAVFLVFIASSRASLISIFSAALLIFSLVIVKYIVFKKPSKRKTINNYFNYIIFISPIVLILLFLYYIPISKYTSSLYYYVDAVLALSTPERGFGSGFTGRINIWLNMFSLFSQEGMFLGHGIRSSDIDIGAIDNGYIVLIYVYCFSKVFTLLI